MIQGFSNGDLHEQNYKESDVNNLLLWSYVGYCAETVVL